MKNIDVQPGQIVDFDEAFSPYEFGDHGKAKTGFGSRDKSPDNVTSICGSYVSGNRLLEEVGFDPSATGGMGGDQVLVLADKPYALKDDTDCHIVGYAEYGLNSRPGRLSGFVNMDGIDPDPPMKRDSSQPGAYPVPRNTHHYPNKRYYWHLYRENVNEGQAYPALTLEVNGHTPQTDTTYEGQGYPESINGVDGMFYPSP